MDPFVHTMIAIACMVATYIWGRQTSARNALEVYTEFLIQHKFLKIEKDSKGEEQLVAHKD